MNIDKYEFLREGIDKYEYNN